MKYGIELEVIGLTVSDARKILSDEGISCDRGYGFHNTKWIVHDDASIKTEESFELVSPPLEFGEDSFETIRKICRILKQNGCGVSDECGFHIHISADQLNFYEINSIYKNYGRIEHEIDQWVRFPRRRNLNTYCRSIKEKNIPSNDQLVRITNNRTDSYVNLLRGQAADRYSKVNLAALSKYKTIEFRHMHATLNADEIINWMKYINQFVVQCCTLVGEVELEIVRTPARPATITQRSSNFYDNYEPYTGNWNDFRPKLVDSNPFNTWREWDKYVLLIRAIIETTSQSFTPSAEKIALRYGQLRCNDPHAYAYTTVAQYIRELRNVSTILRRRPNNGVTASTDNMALFVVIKTYGIDAYTLYVLKDNAANAIVAPPTPPRVEVHKVPTYKNLMTAFDGISPDLVDYYQKRIQVMNAE